MSFNVNKKAGLLVVSGIVLMLTVAFGAYQIGLNTSLKSVNNRPLVEEDASPDVISDKAVSDLGNRIARLQNRLEKVKAKSTQVQANIDATQEVSSNLEAMNTRIDVLPKKIEPKEVSLPPDSPSAKALARPRTTIGISVSVLEDYQKEISVSLEEVEELMRRTE